MTIPKKRHTSSKVARRRSHHALKKIKLTTCKKCGYTDFWAYGFFESKIMTFDEFKNVQKRHNIT